MGPLIAWRRASVENLKRNFLWPVVLGVVAAAVVFLLGVRSALAALTFAVTVFVAATIAVDLVRATRARLRTGGESVPAVGNPCAGTTGAAAASSSTWASCSSPSA